MTLIRTRWDSARPMFGGTVKGNIRYLCPSWIEARPISLGNPSLSGILEMELKEAEDRRGDHAKKKKAKMGTTITCRQYGVDGLMVIL